MPQRSSLIRLALPFALLLQGACWNTQHKDPVYSPLACTASQMLVVENHSSYAVRVYGTEGGINAMPNAGVTFATVQSGTVDTIRSLPGGNREIGIAVDRPPLPSGALERTSGISARCVPNT